MRLADAALRTVRRLLDLALLALVGVVIAVVVLARLVPTVTGGTVLVVAGGSMAPAIPTGAAVVAMPVTETDLRTGDVVSLRVGPQRAVFTHRITSVVERDDGTWIRTKGDANESPDPSLVPASAVIGRVEATIPWAGYLIALFSTVAGVAFAAGVAGCLLVAAWLLETIELDRGSTGRRRAALPAARRTSLGPGAAG